MGIVTASSPPRDGYTIQSPHNKQWLPAVASTATDGDTDARTPGNSDDLVFLLDDDGATSNSSGGRSSFQSTVESITLASLKAKIAALELRLAAGDGSHDYRDCVREMYKPESTDAERLWGWNKG